MLKTIVTIAVVIGIALAALLAYAATKPDTFQVQRAMNIKAPPEKIFPLINDFRSWSAWSPYENKDPAMKKTYSGADKGKGAVYEWDGDKNVGKGRMELADASPPSRITLKLDFVRPFKASNIVDFTLEPRGDATNVTWAMHGPNLFVGKVMSIFINMDTMVGKDFETGLNNLRTLAEK